MVRRDRSPERNWSLDGTNDPLSRPTPDVSSNQRLDKCQGPITEKSRDEDWTWWVTGCSTILASKVCLHSLTSLIREGRADDRSIPAIIANTEPSGLEYVLEVANIDMERNRQLRLKGKKSNGAQSYQSTTTSASATPSIHMGTSTSASSRSIISSGGHHEEVDEFVTNTVPGFSYLGQNTISNSTSSYPSPAGQSTQNESGPIWQDTTESGESGDQSFWELINGGAVDDLDFSAFLQEIQWRWICYLTSWLDMTYTYYGRYIYIYGDRTLLCDEIDLKSDLFWSEMIYTYYWRCMNGDQDTTTWYDTT